MNAWNTLRSADNARLSVRTDSGTVRGAAHGDLIAFMGIPFAQPPIGAWRWRAPEPVRPWEGVRDASVVGRELMQLVTPGLPGGKGMSEDCLYLNVWRPAGSSDAALPVMIWLSGGDAVRRLGPCCLMDRFARQGDMVVVSVSYRENRFGFFAHPALADEAPDDLRGNYAYMDQIAALEWVQRNIAAFGGDPGTVTIAGQSAGGGSVLALMISPMARGLFHRAILESPGLPSPRDAALPFRNLDSAESRALEYADDAGIRGNGGALAALRALPADQVATDPVELRAAMIEAAGGPQIRGFSGPMIDGRLIPETAEAALRGRRHAMVPVICGANNFDLAPGAAKTKDAVFAQFGALAAQARSLYDPTGDASVKALRQAVYADRTMIEPTRHLAEMMTRARQPAYYYRFSYVGEPYRETLPGALHGMEIPYACDLPVAFDGKTCVMRDKAEADRAMARTMAGYWANFVRSGDPNGAGLPGWPRYDPVAKDVLDFANAGVTAGRDPLRSRLDLWQSVFEQTR